MQFIEKTDHLDKNEEVKKNSPEYLVLHATHFYPEWEDLLRCHLNRGFAGVGYHVFISKSGKAYKNRKFEWQGAHCVGLNQKSIGLCFYLGEELLDEVKESTREAIREILKTYPNLIIISHTQGQLMHINNLLEKEGFEKHFPEGDSVVEKENFEQIKKDAESLLTNLENETELVKMLRNLKNCPEKHFYEFKILES